MSTTVRRRPPSRSHAEAHALFHLQAGGAKVLNLRHIPGDTSAKALLERGMVRVDRQTVWGNNYGERSVMGSSGGPRPRTGDQRSRALTITTPPPAPRPRSPAIGRARL